VAIPSCWSWSLIFVLDLKLGGSDPCITAISQLKSQYSIAQARYWRVMSRMKSTLMILTRPISQLVVRPQNALDLSSAEHRSHTASSLHCTKPISASVLVYHNSFPQPNRQSTEHVLPHHQRQRNQGIQLRGHRQLHFHRQESSSPSAQQRGPGTIPFNSTTPPTRSTKTTIWPCLVMRESMRSCADGGGTDRGRTLKLIGIKFV
jgi:hypothetical protein